MCHAEALEQVAGGGLLVGGQGKQHVLGPDVGRPELARLLISGQERRLRVRRQRGSDVRALVLVGLLLELGQDRVGVGVDLGEDMADDVVLQGCVEQMVAVEVEAAPLERSLRGPLEELARRVAEELGHVDALDLALGPRAGADAA